MFNTLRTAFRRKLLAFIAAPLLMGTVSAAAPAPNAHAAAADQVTFMETYYSSAAQTQVVGYGYWYCDGDFILTGYQTPYAQYKFIAYCP
jgi:hypothetical protein